MQRIPFSIQSRWLPLFFLGGFGILMGFIPPLAKLAEAAGVSAPAFAFWQALGAGTIILALCLWRRQPIPVTAWNLRFYAVAALTGISLPNLIIFLVVSHLGAGLASLTYAFPPLFTLVLAVLMGMERLMRARAAGIGLGVVGTLMILLPQGGLPDTANPGWLLFALSAPLILALGNVYRTRDWPPNALPLPLTAGMLLLGAAELAPALPWAGGVSPTTAGAALPVLGAAVATGLAYMMFLELQRLAGPVYLSQVGFVMTPTSMAVGVLLLGERYSPWVWGAVATVFLGVALSSRRSNSATGAASHDGGGQDRR